LVLVGYPTPYANTNYYYSFTIPNEAPPAYWWNTAQTAFVAFQPGAYGRGYKYPQYVFDLLPDQANSFIGTYRCGLTNDQLCETIYSTTVENIQHWLDNSQYVTVVGKTFEYDPQIIIDNPFSPPPPSPPPTPPPPPKAPCNGLAATLSVTHGTWASENMVMVYYPDRDTLKFTTPTYTNADNGITFKYPLCFDSASTDTALFSMIDTYGDGWNSNGNIRLTSDATGEELITPQYLPSGAQRDIAFAPGIPENKAAIVASMPKHYDYAPGTPDYTFLAMPLWQTLDNTQRVIFYHDAAILTQANKTEPLQLSAGRTPCDKTLPYVPSWCQYTVLGTFHNFGLAATLTFDYAENDGQVLFEIRHENSTSITL